MLVETMAGAGAKSQQLAAEGNYLLPKPQLHNHLTAAIRATLARGHDEAPMQTYVPPRQMPCSGPCTARPHQLELVGHNQLKARTTGK
jgi:hypothetical protein